MSGVHTVCYLLRLTLPPVDLRAVCFVRAIVLLLPTPPKKGRVRTQLDIEQGKWRGGARSLDSESTTTGG